MKLTKEDLKIAEAALEVSAWQIFTKSWKVRIEKVYSALRAGLTPPERRAGLRADGDLRGPHQLRGRSLEWTEVGRLERLPAGAG